MILVEVLTHGMTMRWYMVRNFLYFAHNDTKVWRQDSTTVRGGVIVKIVNEIIKRNEMGYGE